MMLGLTIKHFTEFTRKVNEFPNVMPEASLKRQLEIRIAIRKPKLRSRFRN